MTPYEYQEELSDDAFAILRQNMIVYLAMEERTGKTLTAILTAEKANVQKVLVITKKKALDGWHDTLKAFAHHKNYTVVNYHQAYKHAAKYDLIILDESHNYISAYPKRGKIWKELKPILANTPIIYLSATPYAQGPQQLFNQFALSSWSPWLKHGTFYKWFALYGKPYTKEINGIKIPQYDRCHEQFVIDSCSHLFISKTRRELGFKHEPTDQLHWVELGPTIRAVYNELLEHDIAESEVGTIVCDTSPSLRTTLHQLEGGTVKIGDARFVLANSEKVDYILKHFGDTEDVVIMYNYIAEKTKLEAAFKNARILQATSFAEGVDLHKHKHLIIYSQDFSTARHTQRRARQANKNRQAAITVHFLLVKQGLSEQVYKTVSVNKKNFVDSVFTRTKL